MSQERLDFIGRAALGIGLGATVAAFVADPETAMAATVGLSGAQPIAFKVAIMAFAIWFLCRWIRVRRGPQFTTNTTNRAGVGGRG